jgi:hypothetical protein
MSRPFVPPLSLFPTLLWIAGGLVLLFLIAPILAIVPLSFNAGPFFTYPMPGLSLRWYEEFFGPDVWQLALRNSIIVAVCATALSTALGVLRRSRNRAFHLGFRAAHAATPDVERRAFYSTTRPPPCRTICDARCSPNRRPRATTVRVGLAAPEVGKTAAPAT